MKFPTAFMAAAAVRTDRPQPGEKRPAARRGREVAGRRGHMLAPWTR